LPWLMGMTGFYMALALFNFWLIPIVLEAVFLTGDIMSVVLVPANKALFA
jgi:hypothetical protein